MRWSCLWQCGHDRWLNPITSMILEGVSSGYIGGVGGCYICYVCLKVKSQDCIGGRRIGLRVEIEACKIKGQNQFEVAYSYRINARIVRLEARISLRHKA